MSNLTENKIDFTLTAAAVTANKASVLAISKSLPNTSLTDEQRTSLKALDVDNKVFAEDALAELKRKGSGIIPPFVNAVTMANDLQLFEQLDDLEADLVTLTRQVRDLKRIAGHESYNSALMIYKIFDSAAQAGIPDSKESADKLASRFNAQREGAPKNSGF